MAQLSAYMLSVATESNLQLAVTILVFKVTRPIAASFRLLSMLPIQYNGHANPCIRDTTCD